MEINVNLEEKTCSVVEEESELKDCIVKLADLGFPLTLKDIGKLVESFVNINNVETAKIFSSIGDAEVILVPIGRIRLLNAIIFPLKQATKLSVPRSNAKKNPFLVCHYYNIHEEAIERLNLKNKPHLIWNCDESGLPHEPKKCQVVPEKGQNTILVRVFFHLVLFSLLS